MHHTNHLYGKLVLVLVALQVAGVRPLCQQHMWETIGFGVCHSRREKPMCWAGGSLSQLPQQPERWRHGGIKHGTSQLRKHSKPLSASPGPGSGRTLRETVLESSPILTLLNESFISSWSLVKELEELQVSVTSTFSAAGAGECRWCLAQGGSSCVCQGGISFPSPPCPSDRRGQASTRWRQVKQMA